MRNTKKAGVESAIVENVMEYRRDTESVWYCWSSYVLTG